MSIAKFASTVSSPHEYQTDVPLEEAILQADQIIYNYSDGTEALKGLSMSFPRGKRIGVVGPNGAGKTTLFFHLNGVFRPRSGKILFHGKEIKYTRQEIRTLRSGVGVVFQDANYQLFSASVSQELSFGPMNLKLPLEEVADRVEEAIHELEIESLRDRPTHFLSDGEKKKVAIASILTMRPEVIIFDEPLANVDPKSASQLMDFINKLNAEGKTIIISTHDVNMIYSWADYIYIVYKGQVLGEGSPQSVFENDRFVSEAKLEKPWIVETYQKIVENDPSIGTRYSIPKHKSDLYHIMDTLSCSDMELGSTYVCRHCGLEMKVSQTCDPSKHLGTEECNFTCCGETMALKKSH
jgi:cobalt/nickel transport system ATP-binding protein